MLGIWRYYYYTKVHAFQSVNVLYLFVGNDVNAKDDNDHTCVHAAACSG